MSFTRKFLMDNGVPEDKVDAIMAERNRTLADYIPKSDLESELQKRLKEQGAPVAPTESEDYKKLSADYAKLQAFSSDDFASVKKPYRDMLWEKLDHGDKHKPYADQLKGMTESMPDLFVSPSEPPAKPQFGAKPEGAMPTGEKGPSFMDGWKFVPKKQ